jgi:hypothetical protein
MECGVVAARRRCQEQAHAAMRRQHEDEQRHAVKEASPMGLIPLQRFLKELDKLKQDTDGGTLKEQDYDGRLARIIRELRERGLDADRATATAALADALKRGVITAPVEAHLQRRLGLA